MIDYSREFSLLKLKVEEKFGLSPRTPNDFRALSFAIREVAGQTLGVTTLKRLWGYISNNSNPTYSTLSILSRYAGHDNWDKFCQFCDADSTSDFNSHRFISADAIAPGQRLELKWGTNKSCKLMATNEPHIFRVTEATNIKLRPGDLLTVETFVIGQPFVALQCNRAGCNLGSYSSGHRAPIIEFTALP